ncbi:unnamed protein product [Rhizoctonia solani]|uniref:Uncharacterized protein n=1 Tax=Rhizoctonia solani TaxID=456999 RepID=A0A8H3D5E6_9AGAM|nr:unnamed protein product [Rhizoctonia solani]
MPTTHTTSIYTPSLSSRTSHISSHELAHILLTSFSNPSTESRHLVSLILQSMDEYTSSGSQCLINDDDLKLVSTRSDLVMAVASRVEVDLKNKAWTGDLMTDVKRMYHSIVFKLMEFLIKSTGDNILAAVSVVYSTLPDTRQYLATSTTHTVERDIAMTARKYGISYARETTIERNEVGRSSVPQEPVAEERRVIKMNTGLRSVFKLKKTWGKKAENIASECVEMCETDNNYASDGEASDSGVSMGGSESDEEWRWEEEVGVAF